MECSIKITTDMRCREIHTSDLIRADVGNKDFQDEDVTKVHWEKFNMIGRFIDSISQCQQACREINCREDSARENQGYTEEEDPRVRELLLLNRKNLLLDREVRALGPMTSLSLTLFTVHGSTN